MKYRIEVDVAFENESDAQSFLNQIETFKTDVYAPTGSELIPLYRKAEYGSEQYDGLNLSITDSIDFDGEIISH